MSKKRILIVEDEKDMADLVAMRLKREGYEVDWVGDGVDGLSRVRSSPPDLMLLDVMLPRMSGSEVIAEMRRDSRTAGVPVIMLTAKSEESDVVVGLQLGADDYVTKPFSMSVLLARVTAQLRRSNTALSAKGILKAGIISVDSHRHLVTVGGKPVALTLTEFRLLAALLAAKGRVLSRNQLIDQGMGSDAVVTDRTIDVHITALRHKLGDARKYLKTVRGVGYSLAVEDEDNETA